MPSPPPLSGLFGGISISGLWLHPSPPLRLTSPLPVPYPFSPLVRRRWGVHPSCLVRKEPLCTRACSLQSELPSDVGRAAPTPSPRPATVSGSWPVWICVSRGATPSSCSARASLKPREKSSISLPTNGAFSPVDLGGKAWKEFWLFWVCIAGTAAYWDC